RRHRNAMLPADLARFEIARIAAAEQDDGVVLAAFTSLAHHGLAIVADRHELPFALDWPVSVRRRSAGMEIPVDAFEEGLHLLVVIELRFLRAGKGAQRKVAARRQAEGVDQQEAISARLGGHRLLPLGSGELAMRLRRLSRLPRSRPSDRPTSFWSAVPRRTMPRADSWCLPRRRRRTGRRADIRDRSASWAQSSAGPSGPRRAGNTHSRRPRGSCRCRR